MNQSFDTAVVRKKRIVIYPFVAAFTAASTWLVDVPDELGWKHLATLIIVMSVSSGNAVLAYLDQSASKT